MTKLTVLLLNAAVVIAGSLIGSNLKKVIRKDVLDGVMIGIGVVTVCIGATGVSTDTNVLTLLQDCRPRNQFFHHILLRCFYHQCLLFRRNGRFLPAVHKNQHGFHRIHYTEFCAWNRSAVFHRADHAFPGRADSSVWSIVPAYDAGYDPRICKRRFPGRSAGLNESDRRYENKDY